MEYLTDLFPNGARNPAKAGTDQRGRLPSASPVDFLTKTSIAYYVRYVVYDIRFAIVHDMLHTVVLYDTRPGQARTGYLATCWHAVPRESWGAPPSWGAPAPPRWRRPTPGPTRPPATARRGAPASSRAHRHGAPATSRPPAPRGSGALGVSYRARDEAAREPKHGGEADELGFVPIAAWP